MKKERRDLEIEELSLFKNFEKRVRRWSWFVLMVATYLLLNVFIGFSSAPFYRKVDLCSRFDPSDKCIKIRGKTS